MYALSEKSILSESSGRIAAHRGLGPRRETLPEVSNFAFSLASLVSLFIVYM